MLIKEVLDKTTQFFKNKKLDSPRLDSEILISSALGLRRIDLYLKHEQPLKEAEIEKCREFVRRRSLGEPVAYILGYKDFYKLQFIVDKRVLVPRPETELMVEYAQNWLQRNEIATGRALDMGCGSGCIGLSLAHSHKSLNVVLIDKSAEAIQVAGLNQKALNLEKNTELVNVDALDFNFENEKFDLILANPPYISPDDTNIQDDVKKFEPHLALFAKEQGMFDIVNWSTKAISALKTPGLLIFEIGSTQGEQVKKHFEKLNAFTTIKILQDYSGLDRFVIGEKDHG